MKRADLQALVGTLGAVDHRSVAWADVRWTAFLIHQHLRYEYPGRIHDLHQRLVIIPPASHGGQRLVTHKLEIPGLPVPAPIVTRREERDDFGNLVMHLYVDEVEQAIDFAAWIVVERDAAAGPLRLPAAAGADPRLREPSPLTEPDDALRAAAAELGAAGGDGLALAERISAWVHARMTYLGGVTGVRTRAAQALALGRGVCQDYAHIMLALCRLCGLPARYVSGHLLGEGGTHAWVEVLLPDPHGGGLVAQPFDPTNGGSPGLNYVTVAVGRDYGDVAPTSGTFRAPYGGHLSARQHVGISALEYFDS